MLKQDESATGSRWRDEMWEALRTKVLDPMEAVGHRNSYRVVYDFFPDESGDAYLRISAVSAEKSAAVRVTGTSDRHATIKVLRETFGCDGDYVSEAMEVGRVWEVDMSLLGGVAARLSVVGTEFEVFDDFDPREVAGGVCAPIDEDSLELIYERRISEDEIEEIRAGVAE